jgi:phosphoribosylglycinamide formyltransferase-1
VRIGVLVSGTGTNLQALLDAQARGALAPAEIGVVISNRPGVPALERAARAGVPAEVVEHRGLAREAFEDRLLAALAAHGVEPPAAGAPEAGTDEAAGPRSGGAVVLAGFMRVLTPHFVDRFPLRIVNTHPSILPAFPGVDAVAQALAHGVKLTGVTVHFVDASLDGGPIIAQVAVPVEPGDDAASLRARIQREEHRLLPRVVQRLAAGRLSCQGRHVVEGRAE